MKGFSYVISRDFGFAPNPFGEYCTLATCKPIIRRHANVGDLIIGISPKNKGKGNNLIYGMIVEEKISFNQYWNDTRFQYKKPVMNGSIVQMMGDNIYHYNEEIKKWFQLDSHHSLMNGKINKLNVDNDTKADAVLISSSFYYFGKEPISIPETLKSKIVVGRSHRCLTEKDSKEIWNWLEKNCEQGIHADPLKFKSFKKLLE